MAELITQFEEILDSFSRLAIDVRIERLGGGGGGLCRVRGKRVLFVDADADVATKLERCLAALAQVPEADALYLAPAVREQVERRKEGATDD